MLVPQPSSLTSADCKPVYKFFPFYYDSALISEVFSWNPNYWQSFQVHLSKIANIEKLLKNLEVIKLHQGFSFILGNYLSIPKLLYLLRVSSSLYSHCLQMLDQCETSLESYKKADLTKWFGDLGLHKFFTLSLHCFLSSAC